MHIPVTELIEMDIPNGGITCSVKGYFFYRIAEDIHDETILPKCFLSNTEEESTMYVTIPNEIGESVISEDETFGMMVGGSYAYYGLSAEVTGIIEKSANELIFRKIDKLHLTKNNLTQDFVFSS